MCRKLCVKSNASFFLQVLGSGSLRKDSKHIASRHQPERDQKLVRAQREDSPEQNPSVREVRQFAKGWIIEYVGTDL